MRQLVALLGLLWVGANLLLAYLFVTSGLSAKAATKFMTQQVPLVGGGTLMVVFSLFLIWQCLALALSRKES